MSIGSIDSLLNQVRSAASAVGGSSVANKANATGGGDFGATFSRALSDVSKAQTGAETMQKKFSMEDPTVSLEDTMVSMQKADVGFRAALQVRNKLVQAYSEVMNMQV
ncbi:flagellar hook-basal body complex protein FliE [soil metagenome]